MRTGEKGRDNGGQSQIFWPYISILELLVIGNLDGSGRHMAEGKSRSVAMYALKMTIPFTHL